MLRAMFGARFERVKKNYIGGGNYLISKWQQKKNFPGEPKEVCLPPLLINQDANFNLKYIAETFFSSENKRYQTGPKSAT
jgi:hypothetical protein